MLLSVEPRRFPTKSKLLNFPVWEEFCCFRIAFVRRRRRVRGFVRGSRSARGCVGSVASWRRGCDFSFFYDADHRRTTNTSDRHCRPRPQGIDLMAASPTRFRSTIVSWNASEMSGIGIPYSSPLARLHHSAAERMGASQTLQARPYERRAVRASSRALITPARARAPLAEKPHMCPSPGLAHERLLMSA